MLGRVLSAAAVVVLAAISSAVHAAVAAPASIKIDVFTGDPAAAESTWNRIGGASFSAAIGADGTFRTDPTNTIENGFALLNVSMAGDIDPFLTYGFDARNDSTVTQIYSFSFGIPLIPAVSGLAQMRASIAVGLTSGDGLSALNPAAGGVVQRVRISNDGGVNNLVDVPTLALGGSLTAPDADSANYALAAGSVPGPAGNWNYMEIFGRFTLSGGGQGGDVAGLAGRADITPVPEPSTWTLMVSALGCLVLVARRSAVRS